jgi:hypothetical protein
MPPNDAMAAMRLRREESCVSLPPALARLGSKISATWGRADGSSLTQARYGARGQAAAYFNVC